MLKTVSRLAAGVTVLIATSALADDSRFPRPKSLEPAVAFWTRVYTEVTTEQGFIHDNWNMDVVYATVEVPRGLSSRARRERIDGGTQNYRNILSKLASGARSNLSREEQRVLALWPKDVSNAELRSAVERVRFQLGQADRYRAGLARSGIWKPYILQVLEERGLPEELAALPHVESSFDPTAYSKVGAAGMWQFTRSTGVRYMRIDHIIDERRDPFFATEAAARLLADNHAVIQSWPLALTAYNHGLGGMRRAVDQLKTRDIGVIVQKYQSRSFGFASRNFYAAFLAALDVDRNAEKYFPNLRISPPSDTVVVEMLDYMAASTIARALGMPLTELQSLNPALMENVWADEKFVPRGFPLRVPRATGPRVAAALAGIPATERYAAQRPDVQHRVRSGDTLSGIASEYRVSVASLRSANNLRSDLIRAGQLLTLPVAGGGVPPTLAARAATPPPIAEDGTYVVRPGDSIARIAARLDVDADALLAANGIGNRNLIYAGQRLRVPGAATAEPVVALAAATAPETRPAVATDVAEVIDEALLALVVEPGEPEPAAAPAEPDAATVANEVLDSLEPTLAAGEADDAELDSNALATAQADLAADPSDYTVGTDGTIRVQALETLGHYADWLEVRTQQLRDLNRLPFDRAVVLGQPLKLDFSRVDAARFEQRRVAFHRQTQEAFFSTFQIEDVADHVVRAGESLWVLSQRRYQIPVWLVRQYNPDVDLDAVRPGTVVKFPRLRRIG